MYEDDLSLNKIRWSICYKTKLNKIKYVYNMYVFLKFILNNLQWLICHKTKPNQTKSCI